MWSRRQQRSLSLSPDPKGGELAEPPVHLVAPWSLAAVCSGRGLPVSVHTGTSGGVCVRCAPLEFHVQALCAWLCRVSNSTPTSTSFSRLGGGPGLVSYTGSSGFLKIIKSNCMSPNWAKLVGASSCAHGLTQSIADLNPHHQYMDTCLKSWMSKAFICFLLYLAKLLKTQESL